MSDIIRFVVLVFLTGFAIGTGMMCLPRVRRLLSGKAARDLWIAFFAAFAVAVLTGGAAFQFAPPPPPIAYVQDLTPIAGVQPSRGTVTMHGRDFAHSLRYNVKGGDDVSTTFDLPGRFHNFSASVGVTSGNNALAVKFEVFASGNRIASVTKRLAEPPSVLSGSVLEAGQVRVRMTSAATTPGANVNVAWGDATVT